jgi:hypothetical protein
MDNDRTMKDFESKPIVKIKMTKAPFVKGELWWCEYCDSCQVDSDKPETGSFFSQFGGAWNVEKQAPERHYHTMIIFAMCKECMNDNPDYDPWIEHPETGEASSMIDPFSHPEEKL